MAKRKKRLTPKQRVRKLRKENPYRYRATQLRGSLRSRSRTSQERNLVPQVDVIISWMKQQPLVCCYSGVSLTILTASFDHKMPVVRGGANALDNLCLCTKGMNTAKGRMTDVEFRELLKLISTWEDNGKSLLGRLKQGFFN